MSRCGPLQRQRRGWPLPCPRASCSRPAARLLCRLSELGFSTSWSSWFRLVPSKRRPKSELGVVASSPAPAAGGGAEKGAAKSAEYRLPRDWMTIAVGCLVLAYSDSDESWFECVVTKVEQNDVFELQWKDYPTEPKLYRHRKKLGLLHPEYVTS